MVVCTHTYDKCCDDRTVVGKVGAAKVTNKFKCFKVFQLFPGKVLVLLSWPGRSCRTDDPERVGSAGCQSGAVTVWVPSF